LVLWPYVLGGLYCLVYILYPFLYSYSKTPDGSVWVPVNNQVKHCGDNRIYSAGVQEARLNFFKFNHPCSSTIGNMAIDYTRITSYRTAALLGFFISDERISFLVSFALSILIQYSLIFIVALYMFHYAWIALVISLLSTFWFKIIIYFNEGKGVSPLNYLKKYVCNRDGESFFDLVNDNFRYVIMSVAGIYTWITILLILFSEGDHQSSLVFLVFLIYFILIPLVYPSTTLFSLSLLFCSIGITSIQTNNWNQLMVIGGAFSAAILLLFLFGLVSRLKDILQSNLEVLHGSHNMTYGGNEKKGFSLRSIFFSLVKKFYFSISFVLFLILMKVCHFQYVFVPIIFGLVMMLSAVGFFFRVDASVLRLIERGGIHFLFFSICSAFYIISNYFGMRFSELNLLSLVVLPFICYPPLVGCYRMAAFLQKSGAYCMPKEEWEIYQIIKKETAPRSSILAFSVSNLQLLPVYTHSNLFIRGAEWLEDPLEELKKYISALKFIKRDANELLTYFNEYFSNAFSCSPTQIKSEKLYKGQQLINTLIYFPHVQRIKGIPLVGDNKSAWSPDFIAFLTNLINNSTNELALNEIDYILIDKEDFPDIIDISDQFRETFVNKRFILYKKTNQEF